MIRFIISTLLILSACVAEPTEPAGQPDGPAVEPSNHDAREPFIPNDAPFLTCTIDDHDLTCEVTSCGGAAEPMCEPDGSLPLPDCTVLGTPVPPHTESDHECCVGSLCVHLTCDSEKNACCRNDNPGSAPTCKP